MNYGFIPTPDYDSVNILTYSREKQGMIPPSYSYLPYMSPVRNQGQRPTCVPHAVSAVLDYLISTHAKDSSLKFKNVDVPIEEIYASRTTEGDGMCIKDALDFCKEKGLGNFFSYGKLTSIEQVKASIVYNGPCVIATPVKSNGLEFWKGYSNLGGHATALIGFDDSKKKAFLLRNSWGTSYGMRGYAWLPYEDFGCVLEAWAVL